MLSGVELKIHYILQTTNNNGTGSDTCRTTMELLQHNGGCHLSASSPTTSLSDVYLKTNIIINYLPQTMSQDDVHSLFSTIGDVESCKLVRDKSTGGAIFHKFSLIIQFIVCLRESSATCFAITDNSAVVTVTS